MSAPLMRIAPAPDLPRRGEVLALSTAAGPRYYRVARARQASVLLLPLTEEETARVLLAFYDRRTPRWRKWWHRARARLRRR